MSTEDILQEVGTKLYELQTTYDAQTLAVASLMFSADLYNALLTLRIISPEFIAEVFDEAKAAAQTLDPERKPKVIYGDGHSGGLQ